MNRGLMQPIILLAIPLVHCGLVRHLIATSSSSVWHRDDNDSITCDQAAVMIQSDILVPLFDTYTTMALPPHNIPDREYLGLMSDLFTNRPKQELSKFRLDKKELLYEWYMSMSVDVQRLVTNGVCESYIMVLDTISDELAQMEERLLAELVNMSEDYSNVNLIYRTLYQNLPLARQEMSARRPSPTRKPPIYIVPFGLFLFFLFFYLQSRPKKPPIVPPGNVTSQRGPTLQEQLQRPPFNPYQIQITSSMEPPPAYTPR